MAKRFLAIVILLTQGWVFLGVFAEYLVRGLEFPYLFGSLYVLRILVQIVLKDASGQRVFALSKLSRVGPIHYYSFDVLKSLE